ncbi:S8 family peptidase [Aestuariimicrobium kwangyangense]|uniref:S8 family peptidase n=1 Tax=Aestuariimicrobium kwangyangense TaxID=396389 RepID=UPI00047EA177|nr:S8 family serine peptidase [Aestuariimicrobium kwangyangense]
MRKKLPVLLGAGVLALAFPATAHAEPANNVKNFQTVEAGAKLASEFRPGAANPDATVKVVVQLTADPVAVVEANQGKLSKSQKAQLRSSLKASQEEVVKAVKAKGGRVEAQMQSAINGVKVQVKRGDVASLAALPGVKSVTAVHVYTFDNATSVPYLGAPQAWESTGKTGKGVKVAIIDTGIDYTHADFGGPGTAAAYQAAHANETKPADPSLFGPNAPRVKGGIDLVGDAYNANVAGSVPKPDPNPLDCQGHGSHVAGTAAGGGVTADGASYTGPYDSSTTTKAWTVGPGVAPQADLYAVRVFGCAGSTDVTTEAIDWAVANDMDVINMSLGSTYGRDDDASAVAASNAAAAGVVVVASAGNSGGNPYMTGSPASGSGVISVAASDSTATFPGVKLSFNGNTVEAINANAATIPSTPFNIVVVKDNPATPANEAEGCSPASFTNAGISADPAAPAQVAVVVRGTCARVAKAIYGQQAGADAVVMVNSTNDLPPYEGPITENPDTGAAYTVTIPFVGVRSSDGPLFNAAAGQALTMAAAQISNPGFGKAASFSSGGPTNGSSSLKPGVTAPGVSISSVGVGTGNGNAIMSGTSMAAPHVTGVAALAVQAHPTWSGVEISNALVSTSDASKLSDYRVTREGNGLVDIRQLLNTSVLASGDAWNAKNTRQTEASLSFGEAEFGKDYVKTKSVSLTNKGTTARTFSLSSVASPQSKPAKVSISPATVTVPAGATVKVDVTLSVNASDIPSSMAGPGQWSFFEVSGRVVATSGDETLAVPYLLVPRSTSQVTATSKGQFDLARSSAVVQVKNGQAQPGTADFYTLGVTDKKGDASSYYGGVDLRAAGVQSFADGSDQLMVFAVNSWTRFSNAATLEYDVVLDTNRDGKADKIVFAVDSGLVRADDPNGVTEVFIYDVATKGLSVSGFLAQAPTDSSTVLLPVYASDLDVTQASGAFDWSAASYSIEDSSVGDEFSGTAHYSPWNKAISDGDWVELAKGQKAEVKLAIDPAAASATKPLGVMVVSYDNHSGADEALLVTAR